MARGGKRLARIMLVGGVGLLLLADRLPPVRLWLYDHPRIRPLLTPGARPPSSEDAGLSARLSRLEERMRQWEGWNAQEERGQGQAAAVLDKGEPWLPRSRVRIGLGSRQGISRGDVVTGGGYLLGWVEEATMEAAEVRLVDEPGSRFRVVIATAGGGARRWGLAVGMGKGRIEIRYLPVEEAVEAGDTVLSRPASAGEGWPVGVVVRCQDQDHDRYWEVAVSPGYQLDKLEWVSVSRKDGTDGADDAGDPGAPHAVSPAATGRLADRSAAPGLGR